MAILHSSRLKNSAGKKYYISLDPTFGNSSYSVYSFTNNTDYDNKTGTLIYTEPLKKMKKGSTDDLVNDKIGIRNGNFYAWRILKALNIDQDDGVIRASMVHYNSENEVKSLINALDKVL